MLLKDFLSLADLSRAQALYIHKITKVIVVFKFKNLMFATFQVVVPSFECSNNG